MTVLVPEVFERPCFLLPSGVHQRATLSMLQPPFGSHAQSAAIFISSGWPWRPLALLAGGDLSWVYIDLVRYAAYNPLVLHVIIVFLW